MRDLGTTSAKGNVSIKSLLSQFRELFKRRCHKDCYEPAGMEDTKETSGSKNNWIGAHMNSKKKKKTVAECVGPVQI